MYHAVYPVCLLYIPGYMFRFKCCTTIKLLIRQPTIGWFCRCLEGNTSEEGEFHSWSVYAALSELSTMCLNSMSRTTSGWINQQGAPLRRANHRCPWGWAFFFNNYSINQIPGIFGFRWYLQYEYLQVLGIPKPSVSFAKVNNVEPIMFNPGLWMQNSHHSFLTVLRVRVSVCWEKRWYGLHLISFVLFFAVTLDLSE